MFITLQDEYTHIILHNNIFLLSQGTNEDAYESGIQNSITEAGVYQSVLTIDAVKQSDGDNYKCKGKGFTKTLACLSADNAT